MRIKLLMIPGLFAVLVFLSSCGGGGGGGSKSAVPSTPYNVNNVLSLPMDYRSGGLPRGFAINGNTIVLAKYFFWRDSRGTLDSDADGYTDLCEDFLGFDPNSGGSHPDDTAYCSRTPATYSFVSLISTNGLQPIANIKVSQNPMDVAVTADGTTAYVAHVSNAISKLDLVNRSLVSWRTLSGNPIRVLLSPDETKLYVLCTDSGELKVITDLDSVQDLNDNFTESANVVSFAPFQPSSMELNAEDHLLYVGTLGGAVFIVDTDTDTMLTKNNVNVNVTPADIPDYPGGYDSDNDGYTDWCEILSGTDPDDYKDQPDGCAFDADPSVAYLNPRNQPLTDPVSISITFYAEKVTANYGSPIVLDPYNNGQTVEYTWELGWGPYGQAVVFMLGGNQISTPMVHKGTVINTVLANAITIKGTVPNNCYTGENRIWDLDFDVSPSGAKYMALIFDREEDEIKNLADKVSVMRVGADGLLPQSISSLKSAVSMTVMLNGRLKSVNLEAGETQGMVWGGSYDDSLVWDMPVNFFGGDDGDEMEFKLDAPEFVALGATDKVWATELLGNMLYVSTDNSFLTILTP